MINLQESTAHVEPRPIAGLEGRYSVTRCGRVISHWRPAPGIPRDRGDVFLSLVIDRDGYSVVSVSGGGRRWLGKVHRFVCLAFNGDAPPGRDVVNHIDGVKSNNHASNLEWVSVEENRLHGVRMGLICTTGERNGNAKLTEAKVRDIRARHADGHSYHRISGDTGVPFGVVKYTCLRRYWKNVA